MAYHRLPLLLIYGALAGAAQADVYTWTDAQGVRHYSDTARAVNARHAELPGVPAATDSRGAGNRLHAPQSATNTANTLAPDSRAPEIVTPAPEATFRDADAGVPVDVTINGAADLRAGEQITYYLDGRPIAQSPTEQTRLRLANVPRGAHTLTAALLYQGRELRRTSPVTFYMKPSPEPARRNNNHALPGVDDDGGAMPDVDNTAGIPAPPRANRLVAPADRL